jgi:hypothetical protein
VHLKHSQAIICLHWLGDNLLLRMMHIGLCNSIMHWKSSRKNHEKAAVLVMFGTTFYLWAILTFVLYKLGVQDPNSGNIKYLLPITCVFFASIFNHYTFKNLNGYRHTLKVYKNLPKSFIYIINLLAVVFVFASPIACILVFPVVIGI